MCKISKCFCGLSSKKLVYWAKKKYEEHEGTLDLLKDAKTDDDRDAIYAVALLDVPDEDLLELMKNVSKSDEHILECRLKTRSISDHYNKKNEKIS